MYICCDKKGTDACYTCELEPKEEEPISPVKWLYVPAGSGWICHICCSRNVENMEVCIMCNTRRSVNV